MIFFILIFSPQKSEIIGILILKYWRNWNGGLLTNQLPAQHWCYLLFIVIILRLHTFSPKKRTFCITKLCKKDLSQIFSIFFFPFISFTLVAEFNISCTLLWPFYPSKKGKSKATPPKRNKVLHLGNLSQAKVELIVLTFQNTLDVWERLFQFCPWNWKFSLIVQFTTHLTNNFG
jgi:hypothetical protein